MQSIQLVNHARDSIPNHGTPSPRTQPSTLTSTLTVLSHSPETANAWPKGYKDCEISELCTLFAVLMVVLSCSAASGYIP